MAGRPAENSQLGEHCSFVHWGIPSQVSIVSSFRACTAPYVSQVTTAQVQHSKVNTKQSPLLNSQQQSQRRKSRSVSIYILIRDVYLCSAFPAHLHLQIDMPTSFLSSYLAASAKSAVTLFRQIVTLKGITLLISYNVYEPFGEHLGRPKIAHGSHNDVRCLCWHADVLYQSLGAVDLTYCTSH